MRRAIEAVLATRLATGQGQYRRSSSQRRGEFTEGDGTFGGRE